MAVNFFALEISTAHQEQKNVNPHFRKARIKARLFAVRVFTAAQIEVEYPSAPHQ